MTGSGRHPDDDTALWRKVTRGVTPYNGQPELPVAKSATVNLPRKKPQKQVKAPTPRLVGRLASAPEKPKPIDVSAGEHAGIDRLSRRRLVQGNLEIGARLDLHGMTAAQAERSLARSWKRKHIAAETKSLLSSAAMCRMAAPTGKAINRACWAPISETGC